MLQGKEGLACLHLWLPAEALDRQCDLLNRPREMLVAAALATEEGEPETGVAVAGRGLVAFELRAGGMTFSKAVSGSEDVAVLAVPGSIDPDSFVIVGHFSGGATKVIDRSARRVTTTGPPGGEAPNREWEAIAEPSYPPRASLTCVRWDVSPSGLRSFGRFGSSINLFYGECGALTGAPIYFAVRNWRADYTAVFGAVAPHVVSVTVEGPDGTRTLPLSAEGRAFITVYAGEVPPEQLSVRVELADGSQSVFAGARDANLRTPTRPWSPSSR